MQELEGDWLRQSHMISSASNVSSDKLRIWKNTGCTYRYCEQAGICQITSLSKVQKHGTDLFMCL